LKFKVTYDNSKKLRRLNVNIHFLAKSLIAKDILKGEAIT